MSIKRIVATFVASSMILLGSILYLNEKVEEKEEENDSLKDKLKIERQLSSSEIAELEDIVDKKEEDINSLDSKLKKKSKENKKLKSKYEELEIKYDELETINEKLNEDKSNLKRENENLNKEVERLKNENEKLKLKPVSIKQDVRKQESKKVSQESNKLEQKANFNEKEKGSDGGRKLNVQMTAYIGMCSEGCTGVTATGVDVRNSITYQGHRIIATDPSVIPLHSIVEVNVNGSTFTAISLDTGGAINGNIVDFLVGSESEARQFGRKQATVTVLREGK